MKLYVLSINNPGTGPIGHGQAVAACSRGIRGISIDAPEPASGEHRCGSQIAMNPVLVAVEHVGPMAGYRLVIVQRIAGMMWEGYKVDGSHVRFNGHIVAIMQSAH